MQLKRKNNPLLSRARVNSSLSVSLAYSSFGNQHRIPQNGNFSTSFIMHRLCINFSKNVKQKVLRDWLQTDMLEHFSFQTFRGSLPVERLILFSKTLQLLGLGRKLVISGHLLQNDYPEISKFRFYSSSKSVFVIHKTYYQKYRNTSDMSKDVTAICIKKMSGQCVNGL